MQIKERSTKNVKTCVTKRKTAVKIAHVQQYTPLIHSETNPGSVEYPDPRKIGRRVWAIGFGGNVHSGMLLTYNCLPANAGLVDFSITYSSCIFMSEERLTL